MELNNYHNFQAVFDRK